MEKLFDTHCHLTLGELAPDGTAAWERARADGVTEALVVGIDAATSTAVLAFVHAHENLWAAVGIHPNDTGAATAADFETIRSLAADSRVRAIGETGLDFYRDTSAAAVQETSLRWHSELALELGKPLVLHIREAYAPTAKVIEPYVSRGLRAVLHCFGGNPQDLHPFLEWGFFISFSGIITYPKGENVRAAAREVPIERCLVETDAPWLAPVPFRGKRNEPAHVVHTARELARVKGLAEADVFRQTTANAHAFLGIV
ncbi:MAG: TatD family deoxyribonuclease [Planctomycetes bacterium]|nr:TatD family deoxyribonuclease [Planctomycetota bacterium]